MDEILAGVLVGVITGSLTAIISNWDKERRQRKYKKRERTARNRLVKLYFPLIKIIRSRMVPTVDYTGLEQRDIEQVLAIIADNIDVCDDKLDEFFWELQEQAYIDMTDPVRIHDPLQPVYDCDGKFKDYVLAQYNDIRKYVYDPVC